MPHVDPYWVCSDGFRQQTTAHYDYPDVPESVVLLLNGIQIQSDVVSGLSVAAIGFAISIWVRAREGPSRSDGRMLRTPHLILLPVLILGSAAILGFWAGTHRVGYMFEVSMGWDVTVECYITDAREHFRRVYNEALQNLARSQVWVFVLGIFALVGVLLYLYSGRQRQER